MPWYWSDDLAEVLVAESVISPCLATELSTTPVAYRREEETVEEAGRGLVDDDEIPLAA